MIREKKVSVKNYDLSQSARDVFSNLLRTFIVNGPAKDGEGGEDEVERTHVHAYVLRGGKENRHVLSLQRQENEYTAKYKKEAVQIYPLPSLPLPPLCGCVNIFTYTGKAILRASCGEGHLVLLVSLRLLNEYRMLGYLLLSLFPPTTTTAPTRHLCSNLGWSPIGRHKMFSLSPPLLDCTYESCVIDVLVHILALERHDPGEIRCGSHAIYACGFPPPPLT